jgi:hypothetical protein
VVSLAEFLLANGYLVRFSLGEMYEIAIRMASYRERSSSHEESFNDALAALRKLTLPIAHYKIALNGSESRMVWYHRAVRVRREIRENKLNTLIFLPNKNNSKYLLTIISDVIS